MSSLLHERFRTGMIKGPIVMATASTSDVNFETFDFDSVTINSKFINKGAFGDIYGSFQWNNKECALKRIYIRETMPEDYKKKVENKKHIWTTLKHKNLVEIYHVSLKDIAVYLVMEFASGGSLWSLLHRSVVPFPVANFATQIAEGMMFLHENSIVHRDLKSLNIVLMDSMSHSDARKDITLKITDFDEVKEHDHTTIMSHKGTVVYMAPEVLEEQMFSKASDVWSYGVVLREMLTRQHPHAGLEPGTVLQLAYTQMLAFSIHESLHEAFMELLNDCLSREMKNRPSFRKIVDELNSIENIASISVPSQQKPKTNVEKGPESQVQTDTDEPQEKCELNPVIVQTNRTHVAEVAPETTESETDRIGLGGLTILDLLLYAVTAGKSTVDIYDLKKLIFIRRWNFKELTCPIDMASCNRNKCLFILNCDYHSLSSEIMMIVPTGKLVKRWSTGDDLGSSLSVSYESTVIMAVALKSKLNEYMPDGQFIREINLSTHAGIYNPWHAIKMASGDFVVSHSNVDDNLHRVCMVDGDGYLKKSFSGKPGLRIGQLNSPFYLAVYGHDFVMVADQMNHRVLLLDSDLKFAREIVSKDHGLRYPKRILVDRANGRLFAACYEQNNKEISIFEL